MRRFASPLVPLLCALALGACDGDPDPVDAGTPDAGPRSDAGPEVCPNPAWDPSGPPPEGMAPAPTELDVDRDAADGATAVSFDPAGIAEAAVFDLGVQAGAMKTDEARLWTHSTASDDVTLRVWREGGADGEVLLALERTETPGDGGYVHAVVTGLAPATRYRYAFFTGAAPSFDGRSTIGTFTTAIPEGALARIRLAGSTCTNQATRPFESLSWMAEQDPDIFVQLGDMTYNDGDETVEEFRASWAQNLGDEGYRAILSSAGSYYTWDDHEIVDNSRYYDAPASLREAGTQAFYENVPVEPVDRGGEVDFWNAYRWGDSVEILVLDSRSERVPSTRETDDAQYISPAQLAFVQDRLMNSPARFKVLLNSVPITDLPMPPWALEDDRWQGYRAQREALVSFIVDQGIEGVWFLTGDFHMGFVSRIAIDGGARDIWEVAVGPGGSRGGNPIAALAADGVTPEQGSFPCEMFAYWSPETDVATTLDFDPVAGTVHIRFVEANTEEVLFDETIWHE